MRALTCPRRGVASSAWPFCSAATAGLCGGGARSACAHSNKKQVSSHAWQRLLSEEAPHVASYRRPRRAIAVTTCCDRCLPHAFCLRLFVSPILPSLPCHMVQPRSFTNASVSTNCSGVHLPCRVKVAVLYWNPAHDPSTMCPLRTSGSINPHASPRKG